MRKPSKHSKEFLHRIFSSYHIRPIDFEFNENGLGGFTVIYKDGKRINDYIFDIFRGDYYLLKKYLETFE